MVPPTTLWESVCRKAPIDRVMVREMNGNRMTFKPFNTEKSLLGVRKDETCALNAVLCLCDMPNGVPR